MNTHARFGVLGVVLLLVSFTVGGTRVSAAGKAATSTTVAGAWQADPSFIVTGGDVPNCKDVRPQAVATLIGSFNGVWHESDMTAQCDFSKLPNSLRYTNSGTGTFDGIYFGDHSRVSFTFKGTWTGDVISGESIGVFVLTPTDGSRCSFRLTLDGYVNLTTSVGGYNGTWIRGCRS